MNLPKFKFTKKSKTYDFQAKNELNNKDLNLDIEHYIRVISDKLKNPDHAKKAAMIIEELLRKK